MTDIRQAPMSDRTLVELCEMLLDQPWPVEYVKYTRAIARALKERLSAETGGLRIAPGDRRSREHPYRCYEHERRSRVSDLLGEHHYHGRIKDKKVKPHRRHGDPPPTERNIAPLDIDDMDAIMERLDALSCQVCGAGHGQPPGAKP